MEIPLLKRLSRHILILDVEFTVETFVNLNKQLIQTENNKPCNEILRHIHDNGEKENIEKYLCLNDIIILDVETLSI